MRFEYVPFGSRPGYDPAVAVGCDGLPPARVRLSHWPGAGTPPELRRDLSTGIALAYARLSAAERAARFGRLDVVSNDHFDTDGLLAIFAVLNPREALAREEAMLAAAAAGDFWLAPTPRALRVDLVVSSYTDAIRSPLSEAAKTATPVEMETLAFTDLLQKIPQLLDEPMALGALVEDQVSQCEADLAELRSGKFMIRRVPDLDLTIVRTTRPLDPRAVNEVAQTDRILELRPGDLGTYATLRWSSMSWFETTRDRRLPRPSLAGIASFLLESEKGSGEWLVREEDSPFPAVVFGVHGGDHSVRSVPFAERPSSQSPDALERSVLSALRSPLP